MTDAPRVSPSVSVYEALRVHPGSTARLASLGLTPDLYDHRIRDAARVLGVSVERLTNALCEDRPN